MTAFSCQDIRDRGLRLVSPADSEFGSLLEDIRRRTAAPHPSIAVLPWPSIPADLEFAAILRNQSGHAIAALALEWRFEEADGRQTAHQIVSAFAKQLLVPHGLAPEFLRMTRYWSSIRPGSKRLLAGAEMFGENTDARAPEPGEIPFGIGLGSSGGAAAGWLPPAGELREVVLAIDGCFFDNGEFVGPNRCRLWEQVCYEAEVMLEIAGMARAGRQRGLNSADVLAEIASFLGPPDDLRLERNRTGPGMDEPEQFRETERGNLAFWLHHTLEHTGNEATLTQLLAWLEFPCPQLKRVG